MVITIMQLFIISWSVWCQMSCNNNSKSFLKFNCISIEGLRQQQSTACTFEPQMCLIILLVIQDQSIYRQKSCSIINSLLLLCNVHPCLTDTSIPVLYCLGKTDYWAAPECNQVVKIEQIYDSISHFKHCSVERGTFPLHKRPQK